MGSPFVSVWMLTYNHEDYISQAIESVLKQQTKFDVSLYIGEDHSTDNTRNICIDYINKYPDIIKLYLNEYNDIVKNAMTIYNACFNSGAKYIAMLEADDYWTDPYKLQKQVDLLENNSQYSMCFTNAYNLFPDGRKKVFLGETFNYEIKKEYTTSDIVKANFIPTATILMRRELIMELIQSKVFANTRAGDWLISFYLSTKGNIGYIDDITTVRRIHKTGIWASQSMEDQLKKSVSALQVFKKLSSNHNKLIKTCISDYRYKRAVILLTKKRKLSALKEFVFILMNFHTSPRRMLYLFLTLISISPKLLLDRIKK